MAQSKPVHLYIGPEFGERNETINSVKDSLKKKYGVVDEYLYYLSETPLAQAMTVLQSGSLFSNASCVVIRGCESIKLKNDIQMIQNWLDSNPEDSATLILVSDETKVDAKLEKLIPKDHFKIFWEMYDNMKLPWLMKFFGKNGYTLEPDAGELILEMIENNTEALKNECSKFFIVFPQGSNISTENVEQILEHNREESAFTIFCKLTDITKQPNERLEVALTALQKMRLSKENSSFTIIMGLTSFFRKLQNWHKMTAENPYPDEMTYKINGFASKTMRKHYQNGSKIWTSGQTAAVLALLSSADMMCRNGFNAKTMEDIILQKALYEIVFKKGGSSAVWESD